MRDPASLWVVSTLSASGANPTLEKAAPMDPVGQACMDHRTSRANVWRRIEAGEGAFPVCLGCGCEMDVEHPAHDPRCKTQKREATGAVASSGGKA